MGIDSNTRVREVERHDWTGQTRSAKQYADLSRRRLIRDISRCRTCAHSQGVHTETGCAMDDCSCNAYEG